MCAFRREHRVCPQPGTETWRSRDRDTVFLVDQTALVFLDIFTKDEDPLPSRRASSRKTANSSSDAEAEGNGKRSRGRLEPPLPPLPPRASLDQGELEAAALPSAPAWGCTEHGPCAQPCGSAVTPAQTTEVPPHPVATGHSVCWQRAERTRRVRGPRTPSSVRGEAGCSGRRVRRQLGGPGDSQSGRDRSSGVTGPRDWPQTLPGLHSVESRGQGQAAAATSQGFQLLVLWVSLNWLQRNP